MKTILITLLLACALGAGGCSRSDQPAETSALPTATPNQNVKSDAERLQAATAKVAKERELAAQASPTPTASQP